jgi:hypothetical protein
MLIALLVGIVAIILTKALNRDMQQHKRTPEVFFFILMAEIH